MAAEKVEMTYEFGMRGDMAVSRQLNNFSRELFAANDATQVLSAGLQSLARSFGFGLVTTAGIMAVSNFVNKMTEVGDEFIKLTKKIEDNLNIDFSKLTLKNVDQAIEKVKIAKKEIETNLENGSSIRKAQIGSEKFIGEAMAYGMNTMRDSMGYFGDLFGVEQGQSLRGLSDLLISGPYSIPKFFGNTWKKNEDGSYAGLGEIILKEKNKEAALKIEGLNLRKTGLKKEQEELEVAQKWSEQAAKTMVEQLSTGLFNSYTGPLREVKSKYDNEEEEKKNNKKLDEEQKKFFKAEDTVKEALYDQETQKMKRELWDSKWAKEQNKFHGEAHVSDFQKMGGLGDRGGGGRVGPTEDQQLKANNELREINKGIARLSKIISDKGFNATVGE
jgi:hypothetical protein